VLLASFTMKDSDCVAFLQWALPRLGHRWPGYRKVRRQVCKRVGRRIRGLGLADIEEYRAYLDAHDDEWPTLEGLLPITISRFFRERDVFAHLCDTALPQLRSLAAPGPVRIWSAGCAGGEEVYTLSIAAHRLQIPIRLLGTDVDEHQLRRAGDACYSLGSLKDLPTEWRDRAFEARGSKFCLLPEFREHVEFRKQDIRHEMPHGPFHLILCRYLAFTYFDQDVQRRVATQLYDRVAPGGMVVLGKHESWPTEAPRITEMKQGLRIYRAEKRSK
jgi:chemotaxis protein methyltransferase CheR